MLETFSHVAQKRAVGNLSSNLCVHVQNLSDSEEIEGKKNSMGL